MTDVGERTSVLVLIGVYVGALRRPAGAPDLEPGRVASEP